MPGHTGLKVVGGAAKRIFLRMAIVDNSRLAISNSRESLHDYHSEFEAESSK